MIQIIRRYLFVFAGFLLVGGGMIGFFSSRAQQKCQEENAAGGIQFVRNLTWEQVRQKAKDEHKYIFMDCFATWCAPCKKMDKEVFIDSSVAQFINEHFIAVKVQMDKTNHDAQDVQNWYADAEALRSAFAINAYPTYQFFTPEGEPAHKYVGYADANQFIAEAKKAISEDKGYYAMLKQNVPANLDTAELRKIALDYRNTDKALAGRMAAAYLAQISKNEMSQPYIVKFMASFPSSPEVAEYTVEVLRAAGPDKTSEQPYINLVEAFKNHGPVRDWSLNCLKTLDEDQFAKRLSLLSLFSTDPDAKTIADKYIRELDEEELYTDANLRFLAIFTKSTGDRGFRVFYNSKSAARADKSIIPVAGLFHASSREIAKGIFSMEYLIPFFDAAIKGETVNWQAITKKYSKKFKSSFVEETVLGVKVQSLRYLSEKDKKYKAQYINDQITLFDRYGWDTTNLMVEANNVNNFVFNDIFQFSSDPKQLDVAIKWMKEITRRNPDENLMDTYANVLYKRGRDQEAIEVEEAALAKAKRINSLHIEALQINLDKMKRGEPTWQ